MRTSPVTGCWFDQSGSLYGPPPGPTINSCNTSRTRRCRMKPWKATLVLLVVAACQVRGDDWPQWRGLDRSGVSQEKGLLRQWPQGGPKLLWKAKDVGEGYS